MPTLPTTKRYLPCQPCLYLVLQNDVILAPDSSTIPESDLKSVMIMYKSWLNEDDWWQDISAASLPSPPASSPPLAATSLPCPSTSSPPSPATFLPSPPFRSMEGWLGGWMKGGSPNRFEILGVGRDMVGHQEPKILGPGAQNWQRYVEELARYGVGLCKGWLSLKGQHVCLCILLP